MQTGCVDVSNCDGPTDERRAYTKREPVPLDQLPRDVWLVSHVAQALGMSESWVYKRVAEQAIPHTKRRGMLRFDPVKVMEWAKGGNEPSGVLLPLRKGDR